MNAQIVKGARFIVITIALIIAFYFALAPLSSALAGFTAEASRIALNAINIESTIEWLNNEPHLIGQNFDALLSEACWGRLEIAVLAATIIASEDRSIRKRLAGIALGIALVIGAFNPIRIALSIASQSELVHDVLFRFTLLAVLVGYYALWYLALSTKQFNSLSKWFKQ